MRQLKHRSWSHNSQLLRKQSWAVLLNGHVPIGAQILGRKRAQENFRGKYLNTDMQLRIGRAQSVCIKVYGGAEYGVQGWFTERRASLWAEYGAQ